MKKKLLEENLAFLASTHAGQSWEEKNVGKGTGLKGADLPD